MENIEMRKNVKNGYSIFKNYLYFFKIKINCHQTYIYINFFLILSKIAKIYGIDLLYKSIFNDPAQMKTKKRLNF